MAARFAPPPPPTIFRSGVRTPKPGVHSAPEYVVGTETSGRPVCEEAFFAVSIAEPPPTASSESAARGTGTSGDGTSDQRPIVGRSSDQRSLATRNGRSTPSSASTAGSSPSDQRTSTLEPVPGEVEKRSRRARLDATARADQEDVALELEIGDARLGERAGGEIRLDRAPRDERDAVPGPHRAQHRLLQPELELHAEIAEPPPVAAKLVLEQLPHPGPLLHHDQLRLAQLLEPHGLPGEAVAGRADEHDGVAEERLEGDPAMAPRRADDAELELAGGNALDDRLRVEDPKRHAQVGMMLGELAQELRDDDSARPGGGADLERPRQLLGALAADFGDDLLLEREQPLRTAVEAHPRLGRLDAAAGTVEELRAEALLECPHLQADR